MSQMTSPSDTPPTDTITQLAEITGFGVCILTFAYSWRRQRMTFMDVNPESESRHRLTMHISHADTLFTCLTQCFGDNCLFSD